MITKFTFLQLTALAILFSLQLQAQTFSPDLFSKNSWEVINRTSEIKEEQGKKAIFLNEAPGDGAMVLKDYQFSSGTIELDIKGKDLMGQSFVGIAFHAKDKDTFDALYFRPFNFLNADTARRGRAVQYMSVPNYEWEKLRNDFPGKYENKINPVPDPNDWFHVRITIKGKEVKVYVNNEVKPCLEVQKLTDVNSGSLALWVGNNSSGSFANLKITPESGNASGAKIPFGNNPETGKYFKSGDANLYYEIYGKGEPLLMLHGGVYGYIDEFEYLIPKLAENHQVICLATRGHGKSEIGHPPFTYKQRAEDATNLLNHLKIKKAIVIGFSDGGYSAYKMAALYPEMVSKIVVMGAGERKKTNREQTNNSEESLLKTNREYFTNRKKLMPQPERWNESLKMLNDLYNKDFISSETFSKIKCPTLVMAGDSDGYSNVESVVTAFRQIAGAKLSIIPGCGHVILYCNFPAVWEGMQGFVNSPLSPTEPGNK